MSRRAGIIGHPVAHSLSPAFQAAAFAHTGFDVTYELWDTPTAALPSRIESLRDAACLGANVTIPHKQDVIPLLDELGGHSAQVGAVNTIVNREGRLFGFNTDGPGFVRALRNEAAFEPAGASFLLIGAGGAARGIAFALVEARAARLAISNRTPARAKRLAADLQSPTAVTVDPSSPVTGYDCIVNCTSVGMEGTGTESRSPCTFQATGKPRLAVDIVYAPERTAFLGAAEAAGIRTLGGLPMLIYQGALAFEHWTGVPAPVDVMFDAARAELARRHATEARP
jgi:shikimate dehydrogenase